MDSCIFSFQWNCCGASSEFYIIYTILTGVVIMANSHTVLRSNTQRSSVFFYFPNGNILSKHSTINNQDTDTDTVLDFIQISPVLYVFLARCVHLVLYNFATCVDVWSPQQSNKEHTVVPKRGTNMTGVTWPQEFLFLLFYNHTHLLLTLLSSWQPWILSPVL